MAAHQHGAQQRGRQQADQELVVQEQRQRRTVRRRQGQQDKHGAHTGGEQDGAGNTFGKGVHGGQMWWWRGYLRRTELALN